MRVEYLGERCPQCGGIGTIFDPNSGERVCGECGLVLGDDLVNRGPEWRAFNSKERKKRSRMGIPQSLTHWDKGLSTSFNPREGAKNRRYEMWRLKKFDNRSKLDESGMKNLSQAMNELNRIGEKLHLPAKVMERAALLYRKALKKDLIKGRTIDGFVAASIYAACRGSSVPRSLGELSEISAEDKKDIARIYRLLIRELELKMPVDYPMKFVPRIAASLDIGRSTDRLCIDILREAKENMALVGKDPRGMAAAALYMACKVNDEGVTQKDIAYAAGTTEVTLRNRLRDLKVLFEDSESFSWLVRD